MRDHTQILGVLLGTAVGDALGLPFEGLSPRRIARLAHRPRAGARLRHQFFLRRGMVSDDTEHSALLVLPVRSHNTE